MQRVENLCQRLAKLPGLGPRSARRVALALLEDKQGKLDPLIEALHYAGQSTEVCDECGNLDEVQPCCICRSAERDAQRVCVVERVSDLWALERGQNFNGCYHVLGGTLSPLEGRGPHHLRLHPLVDRVMRHNVKEVILATSPSVEGQVTAQYVVDLLRPQGIRLTQLGQGVPVGGDFDYLDDATLKAALNARQDFA